MYSSDACPVYSPFFGAMGVAASICLTCLGASYGTAKAGVGVMHSGILRPDQVIKNSIPVILSGVLGIYGVIVSIMIINDLKAEHHIFKGFIQLGAGLSVGIAGLAAGFSLGIVGDAGARACVQQPRLYVGMVMILIFAEVLAIYGLIVALLLLSSARQVSC
ncbi:V-type ATPase [Eremomyces bilateralis CBS 781.70]|uniref:V-type proton ATPase proteolipid subunit n=1 Tax=Eremomyces bilateralis CBS 781.70 TaxID=1392243 RepID=A0A6G1G911_9PEZI|nr:V-type ATPase [Eremomyces bilateralis CBS 781.70]KAF1814557.1 V-type ATPase [Eremomyces bilateralis CBS 781.70]